MKSNNNLYKLLDSWARGNWQWVISVVVSLLIIGLVLYKVRRKWFPYVLIFRHGSGKEDWDKYAKRYKSLLRQLDRTGLKRKHGETLSNYAIQVDTHFGGEMMTELTEAYEIGIYGGDKISHDWRRLQGMWEDLIKRTSN